MTTFTTETPAPPLPPLTVRSFLLGEGEDLDTPLRTHETVGPLLGSVHGMTSAAGRAVEHELATVVDNFLGLDMFDLMVGGWCRYAALREAAHRTRDVPGSEEVVAMATHRIKSAHRPYIDVYVDGAKIGTLEVELTVVFWISGLVCVVRDAHLTGVRSGQCAVDASLEVRGATLAERRGRRLDLPGAFALRAPVPLLREESNPREARTVPGGSWR